MLSTSGDLLIIVLVAVITATTAVAVSHLVNWRRSRIPRLRLLTGTRSQQAAIVLAVRPVVRELLPARIGLDAISWVPVIGKYADAELAGEDVLKYFMPMA
jgi:hypothetical protein